MGEMSQLRAHYQCVQPSPSLLGGPWIPWKLPVQRHPTPQLDQALPAKTRYQPTPKSKPEASDTPFC